MTTTIRAAQLMTFNDKGQHGGTFTARTRQDWQRAHREARERAGTWGTVLLYSATVAEHTGKVLGVSPTPDIIR